MDGLYLILVKRLALMFTLVLLLISEWKNSVSRIHYLISISIKTSQSLVLKSMNWIIIRNIYQLLFSVQTHFVYNNSEQLCCLYFSFNFTNLQSTITTINKTKLVILLYILFSYHSSVVLSVFVRSLE